jgi:hypothetical protein
MLALLLFAAGCTGFDHRERIVDATLRQNNGDFDDAALGGALTGKFLKKPPESVESFVKSLGGSCEKPDFNSGTMHCQLPTNGTLCVTETISLDVLLASALVASVRTRSDQLTC